MTERAHHGSIPSPDAAVVAWPCADLAAELAFFVDRLGFRTERIAPADDPRLAVIAGHDTRIELRRDPDGRPEPLELHLVDAETHRERTPGGARIDIIRIRADPPAQASPPPAHPAVSAAATVVEVPPLPAHGTVVSESRDTGAWVTGRAGMLYRDLIPGRLGGRFAGSHIRIPTGGPVPDSVHHHAIRFQMIYCLAGWVRVVYEDQGPAFVLRPGDCVLQPPGIRHRVLEASDGLEVLELACPAEHDTWFDHELKLPTSELRAERTWGDQRFVRHVAEGATWHPWRLSGWSHRDTGLGDATAGLASAHVARPDAGAATGDSWQHVGELLFLAVLTGGVGLRIDGDEDRRLATGDTVAVPAKRGCALSDPTADLELLEVRLPADTGAPRTPGPRAG